MARNFRRHRASHPIAELNVTNLIDLGFILLVIFMIATPLIQQQQNIRVELPVESVKPQTPADPRERFETITVQADGRVSLGGEVLTLRQLAVKLAAFAAEAKPPVISLQIDARATAQHYVSVMDELSKHNLNKVALPTKTVK